jgi:hypothetical protein
VFGVTSNLLGRIIGIVILVLYYYYYYYYYYCFVVLYGRWLWSATVSMRGA